MRLEKIILPDVYCIPFWLGGCCRFLENWDTSDLGDYDFIFTELNSHVSHLQYILEIEKSSGHKTIILPGPPEIFLYLTDNTARQLAKKALQNARQVWVYSEQVGNFFDDFTERKISRIIPWPFDLDKTIRLGAKSSHLGEPLRVLIGAPLRFQGIAANAPTFAEECIDQALKKLPAGDRKRFSFHAFLYTREDESLWSQTEFGKKIGVILERKRSYGKFVEFIGSCAAVIQLSRLSILGRNTFIAGALKKPGIFSSNVELNRKLYPGSLVSGPEDLSLPGLIRNLIHELAAGRVGSHFFPDEEEVKRVGDFRGNAEILREMLSGG